MQLYTEGMSPAMSVRGLIFTYHSCYLLITIFCVNVKNYLITHEMVPVQCACVGRLMCPTVVCTRYHQFCTALDPQAQFLLI